MQEIRVDAIDLAAVIRPGNTVLWGQGTGEPRTLTNALVAQRALLGGVRVFQGVSYAETLEPEHGDHLTFVSYFGGAGNVPLAKAGLLTVLPCHFSELPGYLSSGTVQVDAVFLQLSPPNAEGIYSFGVVNDYLQAAIERARLVIAEVNDQVPWTFGGGYLPADRIDYVVRTSHPLLEIPSPAIGPVERAIADHVSPLIEDGAVLQVGFGSVPDAILSSLRHRRNLGIHSGVVGDSVLDLIEAGAVTNAEKPIDRGVTTTGVLYGTRRLYDYARNNPAIRLQPVTYTHSQQVLTRFENFTAINSAIEVDLTGQVNAEVAGEHYVGAVGGQVDFVRAARQTPRGRSIIALPATARRGAVSRIVPHLSAGVVTTPRSDADVVATEFGVAELGGQTIPERIRRMIAIAHPAFRDELGRKAHRMRSLGN